MKKQVDKSHYEFGKYMHKRRWASVWHQLDELVKLNVTRVLEIGTGTGAFKAAASAFGLRVETLDIDPELKPDYHGSVLDLPFENEAYEAVVGFQVLEHLPFSASLEGFQEMSRVAKDAIVISLPDAARRWSFTLYPPPFKPIEFSIPAPGRGRKKHEFNGQHYWEINKIEYPLEYVQEELENHTIFTLKRTFRVHELPYHRFFTFNR